MRNLGEAALALGAADRSWSDVATGEGSPAWLLILVAGIVMIAATVWLILVVVRQRPAAQRSLGQTAATSVDARAEPDVKSD